jgi:hypothetical protein
MENSFEKRLLVRWLNVFMHSVSRIVTAIVVTVIELLVVTPVESCPMQHSCSDALFRQHLLHS